MNVYTLLGWKKIAPCSSKSFDTKALHFVVPFTQEIPPALYWIKQDVYEKRERCQR